MIVAPRGGELCAGKPRHDLPAPNSEQLAHEREPLATAGRRTRVPIEHGPAKRFLVERVRNLIAQLGIGSLEFLASSFAYRIRKRPPEIAKERKRLG